MQVRDDRDGRRLIVSTRARRAMARLYRGGDGQAVVLSWPGGAAFLPMRLYAAGEYNVIIGHVAGCPIYADLRQLNGSGHRRLVLDTAELTRAGRRPLLQLRALDAGADSVGAESVGAQSVGAQSVGADR